VTDEVSAGFTPTEREFAPSFWANAEALAGLAREQLRRHECVSVLGI
jgi:hypothetical protein